MSDKKTACISFEGGEIYPIGGMTTIPSHYPMVLGPIKAITQKELNPVIVCEKESITLNMYYSRIFCGGLWYNKIVTESKKAEKPLHQSHYLITPTAKWTTFPSTQEAAATASLWYGGQRCPLYALQCSQGVYSAGHLLDSMDVAAYCVGLAESRLLNEYSEENAIKRVELIRLLSWLENHPPVKDEDIYINNEYISKVAAKEPPQALAIGVWQVFGENGKKFSVIRDPDNDGTPMRAWTTTWNKHRFD